MDHGTDRCYRGGCRCEICAKARSKRSREKRILRIRNTPFESVPHGRKGYETYMCRCDECRLAGAQEAHRRREMMSTRTEIPHGTVAGYTNYKCRCEDCKKARSEFKRAYDLRTRYGLTPKQFEVLLDSQNHQCLICRCAISTNACVDHSHWTGNVRGLLCRECNFGLGHARDSVAILESAIAYIQERNPL